MMPIYGLSTVENPSTRAQHKEFYVPARESRAASLRVDSVFAVNGTAEGSIPQHVPKSSGGCYDEKMDGGALSVNPNEIPPNSIDLCTQAIGLETYTTQRNEENVCTLCIGTCSTNHKGLGDDYEKFIHIVKVPHALSQCAHVSLDSGTENRKSSEHPTQFVYDGGGEDAESNAAEIPTEENDMDHVENPTEQRHCLLSSPRSNTFVTFGCASQSRLVPRPQEQIGPPAGEDITTSTGEATPVYISQMSAGAPPETCLGSVTHTQLSPHMYTQNSPEKEAPGLADFPARQLIKGEEERRAVRGCESIARKPNCSKRYMQCTLRYKSKMRKYKFLGLAVFYLSAVLVVVAMRELREPEKPLGQPDDLDGHIGRQKRFASSPLMDNSNLSHCAIEVIHDNEKNEIYIMSYDTFMSGGIIIHIIIGMYTFAAIAAICDIYFVPALEHICEDLKLEADVAGATFMAAASSAPEFCTSVIGIFVQENDVGLGAIVGSSIFNLLAIVGLCAIFAGMPVELSWYPLCRDSIFYTVAVFEMLAFMYDSVVHWYEALVMIITYALYILVMVYNKKIEQLANAMEPKQPASRQSSFLQDIHRTHSARLEIIRARSHSRSSAPGLRMSSSRLKHLQGMSQRSSMGDNPVVGSSGVNDGGGSLASQALVPGSNSTLQQQPVQKTEMQETGVDGTPADPKKVAQVLTPADEGTPTPTTETEMPEEHAVAEYENPLEFPEGCINRMYWIAVLPVTALHAYTIPDSRITDSWQSRFYMIPFALSVFYLAIYSYIMVWAMSVAAWGLRVPATVAGLTVLAAGTSVPDCLSSIFVARGGYGDMAVSNAIGSNVFDILLCLGVPWLATGVMESGHAIDSKGMWVSGSTLVVTILYLIISLRLCNWTLTKFYGLLTLIFYGLVISFCILVELNIIFQLHTCD